MLEHKMLSVILLIVVFVPLYLIMSRHDEKNNVCEVKIVKKKTYRKKKHVPSTDVEEKANTCTHIKDEHVDSTDDFTGISDTVITTPVPDLQDAVDEERLTVKTEKDSIGTATKDTVIMPVITPVEYIVDKEKTKSHKWQFLAAGSLGSALVQNVYKLFATGGLGDIDSDVSSSIFPDSVSTWEDYSKYLHIIKRYNTPTDTLALMEIADNNSGDIKETEQHDKPITFGIAVTKPLGDRWSIETGIQYSLLNSRFMLGEGGYAIVKNQKVHYLGVPLKLSYRMIDYKNLSAYSSAGLTLHIPVYGKVNSNYMVDWQSAYSESRHIAPALQWQTGISVGLQYRFVPNVSIFVEPTLNWFIPSESEIHTIWTEHPLMFTSPFGIRITW